MSSGSHLCAGSRFRYVYSLCAAFLATSLCAAPSGARPSGRQVSTSAGYATNKKPLAPKSRELQFRRTAKSRALRRESQRQISHREQDHAYLDQLMSRTNPVIPSAAAADPAADDRAKAIVAQTDAALLRQLSTQALRAAQRMEPRSTATVVDKPMTGFAQEAEGHAASFRLQAGECYLVAAVSETSMRSLTTSLWSPLAERQVTMTGKQAPLTAIRARDTGSHQLIVRPAGGQGRYAAAIFQFGCPDEK